MGNGVGFSVGFECGQSYKLEISINTFSFCKSSAQLRYGYSNVQDVSLIDVGFLVTPNDANSTSKNQNKIDKHRKKVTYLRSQIVDWIRRKKQTVRKYENCEERTTVLH